MQASDASFEWDAENISNLLTCLEFADSSPSAMGGVLVASYSIVKRQVREEQMESQVRLGRVLGIEIGLHYSWFLIALLITLSLGAQFQATQPQWGGAVIWLAALVTGLLFFSALILHELSHAVTARARGLPVGAITLFALGGVSRIEREPDRPVTEFLIGIVGPLTSAVVGVGCLGLAWVLGWNPATDPSTPLLAVLVWLGYINFGLAIFNMVPGYPLDGGRVLRAFAWWVTGDAARATRVAARAGQATAYLFIVFGLLRFFAGAGLGGLWIAFIGWFLLSAAGASYGRLEAIERLRGLRVADVMARDCGVVPAGMSVQELVDDLLLRTGRRCFTVVEGGRVVGLITPHEVKAMPRARWPESEVSQVMRPLVQLRTVAPGCSVADALDTMAREDVHQLPVVAEGRLQGVISRGDVLRVLKTRQELRV
jgi:Zn-dependent protease/predicted transcriptional regulator